MATKVLWLSRHGMTPEQQESLLLSLGVDSIELVAVNMTFAAGGRKAANQIFDLAEEQGCSIVAGVFPAHVAVRLVAVAAEHGLTDELWVPVSAPAAAKDGEVRGGGFVHSHWENLVHG